MKVSFQNFFQSQNLKIKQNKNQTSPINVQKNSLKNFYISNNLFLSNISFTGGKQDDETRFKRFEALVQALFGDKKTAVELKELSIGKSKENFDGYAYLHHKHTADVFDSIADNDGKKEFGITQKDGTKKEIRLSFDEIYNKIKENSKTISISTIEKFNIIVQALYGDEKPPAELKELPIFESQKIFNAYPYLYGDNSTRTFNSIADEDGKREFEITHKDGTKEKLRLSFEDIFTKSKENANAAKSEKIIKRFQALAQALYGDDKKPSELSKLSIDEFKKKFDGYAYLNNISAKNSFAFIMDEDGKGEFEITHQDGKKEKLRLSFEDIRDKSRENSRTSVNKKIQKFNAIVQALCTDKKSFKQLESLTIPESNERFNGYNYLFCCPSTVNSFNSIADEDGKREFEITREDGTKEKIRLSFEDIVNMSKYKNIKSDKTNPETNARKPISNKRISALRSKYVYVIKKHSNSDKIQGGLIGLTPENIDEYGIEAKKANTPYITKYDCVVIPVDVACVIEDNKIKRDENNRPILQKANIKEILEKFDKLPEKAKSLQQSDKTNQRNKIDLENVDIAAGANYQGTFEYNKETREVILANIPQLENNDCNYYCVLDLEKQKYAIYSSTKKNMLAKNIGTDSNNVKKMAFSPDEKYSLLNNRFAVFSALRITDIQSQNIQPEQFKDLIKDYILMKELRTILTNKSEN